MKQNFLKISDYSLIGDLQTTALVGKNGSIDWYCLPYLNSNSIFSKILDAQIGGQFSIEPSGRYRSKQNYIENTNILETHFQNSNGSATLTDFMPIKSNQNGETHCPIIMRKITCTKGSIKFQINFQPAFDYARAKTTLKINKQGITARGDHQKIYLFTPIPLIINQQSATGKFKLNKNETYWFILRYNKNHHLTREHCEHALETTNAFWLSWVNDRDVSKTKTGLFNAPWRKIIIRSGLVLKLLIEDNSGAICAAPTTSLPESIGGKRNWDYRFNWIRDASFTVEALYNLGYIQEAQKNLQWFLQICTENIEPKNIQPLYGLHGETDLKEEYLIHLSGYKKSTPVRIGNHASNLNQLDIYGELINAFYQTSRFGRDITDQEWDLLSKIVEFICTAWHQKDAGIWETRGKYQHFVHSKLMCWVAFDRAIKIAETQEKRHPNQRWSEMRDIIKKEILKKGYNHKLKSFVQAYDSDIIDSTALLIPIHKLLPFNDPRVQGTLNAIIQKLSTKNGLLYRYENRTDDGFKGKEGAFLLSSFWLIDVLAYSGRTEEAKKLFLKMLDYTSPTGLLAEEINFKTGNLLGNYPQAYSHIGLINSALFINKAEQEGLLQLTEADFKNLSRRLRNIIKE